VVGGVTVPVVVVEYAIVVHVMELPLKITGTNDFKSLFKNL
jgi:hypothetical protein